MTVNFILSPSSAVSLFEKFGGGKAYHLKKMFDLKLPVPEWVCLATPAFEIFVEQIRGLMDGGADILLPETSIDTLMMKAQLFAIEKYFEETGKRVPVFASNSIFNKDGRTLSGQTLEAFWLSISHAPLTGVGLNCGMAPTELRSYVEELSNIAPVYTHAYLNAGLPNPLADSGYDWSPQQSADAFAAEYALAAKRQNTNHKERLKEKARSRNL